MATTESLERVRYAGLLERYHISLADLGLDTCVVSPATYSSTSSAVLDYTTALHALKRIIPAHPALCVQHGGTHDKKPYFVRLPRIDLNDVLTYDTDVTVPVSDLISAELLKPFLRSATKPLWRVTVRPDNVVVFAWHHSIADGGCAHSFHAAFLSALNSRLGDEDTGTVATVPEKLALPPTIEDRTDVSVSLKATFATLYDSFAPLFAKDLRKAWTASPVPKEPSLNVKTRIRKIEPETARTLIALCREHKCTLTSFMHTLVMLVLSRHYAALEQKQLSMNGKLKKYKTFSTAVPISLRRFTGTSPLEICDQVSLYHSFPKITRDFSVYPPTKESFPWQTAAKYTTALHGNLKTARGVIGTIGFVYKLGQANDYFNDHLGNKRENTFVLSNIGAMPKMKDLGEEKRDDGVLWHVDDVGFGQNDVAIGPSFKLNMAGSPSGAVSAIYNWGPDSIDTELVEAVIEDVHNSIVTILSV